MITIDTENKATNREWSVTTENCIIGCSHDCLYCYAKEMAVRHGRVKADDWKNEKPNQNKISKNFGKRDGRIMFPSAHDITPDNLNTTMNFLEKLLTPGNDVLIVSKPDPGCIKAICARFSGYKDKILFRFTIGSSDSTVLKFWEPNSPDFKERLEALKHAHRKGFQTSVSSEPMLDDNIEDVINQVEWYVTDAIWLGTINRLRSILSITGVTDPAILAKADELIQLQSDDNIKALYDKLKTNSKIKWKASIKKVVGIPLSTVKGEDV